jgi:hypothetical protein
VSSARKVTKHDFSIIANLIFDSYVVREIEVAGKHFTLRSLTYKEREDISRKYKYLSNKYNMILMLDILSKSIQFVNGLEFVQQKHDQIFRKLNSRIILNLYDEYQKIDQEINESSKFIDFYVESKESRNLWAVFKTCSRITDPFAIRLLNQYQFYWIITNVFKDEFENEKKQWTKTEYMTNSICAFINPKGYKKAKSHKSVVEQLEENEDLSKRKIVDELEGFVPQEHVNSNDVFSAMSRQQEETEEEYETRINVLMEKTLKGEIVDEHDRIVRASEIECLKNLLREKRKEVLVQREVNARRGIEFEQLSYIADEAFKIQLEEDKKQGFFHDEFSYLDVIKMKDFIAVSKKEKEQAFEEVMNEQIDVEGEVDRFLKSLSGQDITSKQEEQHEQVTIDNQLDNASEGETDSSDVIEPTKMAASKAASMNVNVQGVDLLKQKKEKNERISETIQRRNLELNSDFDVMKFE